MFFRRAGWLTWELLRNEDCNISPSNLFYGTNSLCLLLFFFLLLCSAAFLTWICLILRSFMGILRWHKLAELLKEAVSIPQILPGCQLAPGPGLVLLKLQVNPLQNQQQKQQNQNCPGSVPRSSSWHSCMKGEWTVRDEKWVKMASAAGGEAMELLSAVGSWPLPDGNDVGS